MWFIAADIVVVCLSVCHDCDPCKNGWTDCNDFGVWTWVGTRNRVLDVVQISRIWRHNFEGGKGRPIVKYRDCLPWAVQNQLNQSRCHLGCRIKWAKGTMYGETCMGPYLHTWRSNFKGFFADWKALQSIGFGGLGKRVSYAKQVDSAMWESTSEVVVCYCRRWRPSTCCWTKPTTSTSCCRSARWRWSTCWCVLVTTVQTAPPCRQLRLSQRAALLVPRLRRRPHRRLLLTRTFRCWHRSTVAIVEMLSKSSAKLSRSEQCS